MNDSLPAERSPDDLRPDGLGPRAAALWDDMTGAGQPAWRAVLLGEACRLTDRLDKLDALLTGEAYSWARLVLDEVDEVYDLRVDSAVAEARQTAATLRLVLAQLTPVSQRTGSTPPSARPITTENGGGRGATEVTLADEVAARRAAMRTSNP